MPGMKITLNAAMRARDVSRPRPEQEAAAEQSANEPAVRPAAPATARTIEIERPSAGQRAGPD